MRAIERSIHRRIERIESSDHRRLGRTPFTRAYRGTVTDAG